MLCLLKTSCTYRGKGNSSCLILSVLSILSAYTFILLNTPTPYLKNLISCLRILAYNLLTYSYYPSSYLLAFHLTSGYLGIHSPPFGGGARGRGYLLCVVLSVFFTIHHFTAAFIISFMPSKISSILLCFNSPLPSPPACLRIKVLSWGE